MIARYDTADVTEAGVRCAAIRGLNNAGRRYVDSYVEKNAPSIEVMCLRTGLRHTGSSVNMAWLYIC